MDLMPYQHYLCLFPIRSLKIGQSHVLSRSPGARLGPELLLPVLRRWGSSSQIPLCSYSQLPCTMCAVAPKMRGHHLL